MKWTTSKGKVVASKLEIFTEVKDFYGKLYTSVAPRPQPDPGDPRATLAPFTEELPEVSQDKIAMVLGQLKNGKSLGEDGITTELLKAAGKPLLARLQRIFNSYFRGELQRHIATTISLCSSKKETKPF
ncbi:uncharacterized protein LOC126774803 [Nymphalis io]|uniref:uncharacterized protein LOC126774803 n=1 Tax=Inachis io TaxID=171585 RepID=UPI00216A3025|nr:uncharacterized protein LOC126774803 [Nymphalis io]